MAILYSVLLVLGFSGFRVLWLVVSLSFTIPCVQINIHSMKNQAKEVPKWAWLLNDGLFMESLCATPVRAVLPPSRRKVPPDGFQQCNGPDGSPSRWSRAFPSYRTSNRPNGGPSPGHQLSHVADGPTMVRPDGTQWKYHPMDLAQWKP